ncbi:MAG: NUDIX domain-containing protein [Candidatus Taylorbacteria bacterium]
MKQIALINKENVSPEEAEKFSVREASRAIVFDDNKMVALLHATNYGYHKLPGGGIEKGEDPETAMKRECVEEIGCTVKVISELGKILEYRKKYNLRQTSYCYIAEVVGKKGAPNLMEDEMEEGFQTIWMPLKEAYEMVRNSDTNGIYEAQYMVARDTAFLQAAVDSMLL